MNTAPKIRPVTPQERDELIRFWMPHFSCSYECLERPMRLPWYSDHHCLIIRDDEGVISAAVCERRTYEWLGRSVACGAVGEVATAERGRGRGLASMILRRHIEAMESDGTEFSLLMTGVPELYSKLGWEHISLPRLRVRLVPSADWPDALELPATPIPEEVKRLYRDCPRRPLHFPRPEIYWQAYAGWSWENDRPNARMLLLPGEAYAAVFRRGDGSVWVDELRAMDASAELRALSACARWAIDKGAEVMDLRFTPQFLTPDHLTRLGEIERYARTDWMIRRVNMPPGDYADLIEALQNGAAALWDVDEF